MIQVTPRLVFLVVLVLGISAFLFRDRKNVKRHFILFYRRTERGIDLIDRIAKRFPRFWKFYGSTGVVVGLLSLVASVGLVATMIGRIALGSGSVSQEGPKFIAPSLGSQASAQPGFLFIPVEYWVISIAVLMFVHELSHGIVARTEGFELNSVGWIILGVIPGAFVEPKGEKMLPGEGGQSEGGMWEGGSWKSRLKVLCAGSFANYLTAALFLLMFLGVSMGATNFMTHEVTTGYIGILSAPTASGINYSAQKGFPAYKSGMRNGTLYRINGKEIDSLEDIDRFSKSLEPGDNVSIYTSEGNFTITAANHTVSRFKPSFQPYTGALNWLLNLFYLAAIINLFVGLFNMLPFKPLDGGLAAETLLEKYTSIGDRPLNTFSMLGWSLLLTLLLGSMILGLL